MSRRRPKLDSAPLVHTRGGWIRWCLASFITLSLGLVIVYALDRFERRSRGDSAGIEVQTSAPHVSEETPASSLVIPGTRKNSWSELDDPNRDGWKSEVFSQRASRQLNELTKLLASDHTIQTEDLTRLAVAEIGCTPLLPPNLVTVYEDEVIQVRRPHPNQTTEAALRGFPGLLDALQPLQRLTGSAYDVRCEFKLFRVDPDADLISTEQFFSLTGNGPSGRFECHAKWVVKWRDAKEDELPRMIEILVRQFEQSTKRGARSTLFADCTDAVLSRNECYRAQLLYGFNHWLQRSQDDRFNFLLGNPGVSVGDVNGDGLDDLYLCQEEGLPNRLFVQQQDGTARDVSEEAGVNWIDNSKCALLVDLDNDGDQDLAVALTGGVALAANNGDGEFHLRAVLETSSDVISLTAADYDSDGRLDLYVGVYHRDPAPQASRHSAIAAASAGVVYHDANSGGPNSLLRNGITSDGQWSFTDVTKEVGLDVNNRRFTLAAAWEDFDNDGDQDLYVANDFGRNNLYRNEAPATGGHLFTDIAADAHTEDSASGMSVTWGDYDRDGWVDLYVGNMFSAAGNRITFQPQFKPKAPVHVKSRIQRFARGNTMYRNRGAATAFADTSDLSGVTMGQWSWSSNFVDLNNDGWDDLVVANGYITTEDTGDL